MEENTPVIWRINIFGGLLFVGGMFGSIMPARDHAWLQLSGWLILVVLGWCMMTVHRPHTYPEKLFKFTWHDFIHPTLLGVVLTVSVGIPTMFTGQVKEFSKYIVALWIVWTASMVMIRIGGRIGTKLAKK